MSKISIKLIIVMILAFSPFGWAGELTKLPVVEGLVLDLNANKEVEVEDGDRVVAWYNQVKKNEARAFVKRDKGRKIPGSGRPTLKTEVEVIGGNNTVIFKEQELVNHNEDAFDHIVRGEGYTWLSVMCVYTQHKGKKDVNSFFGNLRNGPPYEGLWGNLMDDNSVWIGTRNGYATERLMAKSGKGTKGLWHEEQNPCVWNHKPLVENKYYLVMGRMGKGVEVVNLDLFINGVQPADSKSVPVNTNANPSKMVIGQERDAINHPGAESFHGEIARFLIYERPLSNNELQLMATFLKKTYLIE